MKTIFAFWVSVALVVSFSLAEEVPPAFEIGRGNQAAEAEVDPFDPMIDARRLIRVQVEHIEMSHKDLTRLLMEDKAETTDAKVLRMKVQELVEKDQAKVLDTQIVVGRSGEKQKVDSRQEFIYPTEFTPESMDDKMKKMMKDMLASPFPSNPAMPTAFETRNLGSSLECEPVAGFDENRNQVDLRIESELIWHTGNTVWSESKDASGNAQKITMPDFYLMDIITSITCISGQYVLVGALSPKNAEGKLDTERKVMVFVKCDILYVVP